MYAKPKHRSTTCRLTTSSYQLLIRAGTKIELSFSSGDHISLQTVFVSEKRAQYFRHEISNSLSAARSTVQWLEARTF